MAVDQHYSSEMPRLPRFVLPGYPHHVTHRGNDRQRVFFDAQDYLVYRRALFAAAGEHHVAILAFCLMPNHIHAICVPREKNGLTRMFGRLQSGFSRFSNVRRDRCGHVWQERFYSCVMDHNHTFRAMAYIEQNPVRAASGRTGGGLGVVQRAGSSGGSRSGRGAGSATLERVLHPGTVAVGVVQE
jgi:REP element-mobilizing transposase RayT